MVIAPFFLKLPKHIDVYRRDKRSDSNQKILQFPEQFYEGSGVNKRKAEIAKRRQEALKKFKEQHK